MTWPASPVPGAVLSDRFAWAFPMNKDPTDPSLEQARRSHAELDALVQPAALAEEARALQLSRIDHRGIGTVDRRSRWPDAGRRCANGLLALLSARQREHLHVRRLALHLVATERGDDFSRRHHLGLLLWLLHVLTRVHPRRRPR